MKTSTQKLGVMLMVFALIYSLQSCSTSDDSTEEESIEETQEEQASIPLADLESGISIPDAAYIAGAPPSPNSSILFKINTDGQSGYLNTGYTVPFTANDDIAGAYLRILEKDGETAGGYFDIPASSFEEKRPLRTKKENEFAQHKLLEENDYEINVKFSNTIPVGTFCYEICIYDSDNNISQPSTVCVTVEEWGGPESGTGSWLFDRYDPANLDEDRTTINCNTGGSFEADYQLNEKEDWVLTLESNGNYNEVYDDVYRTIDYDASAADCEAVYGDTESYKEQYLGKWTYNASQKTISIVDFEYKNLLDSSENETYENGILYVENALVEVISGELVLTETYIEDGREVTLKGIFKKQ